MMWQYLRLIPYDDIFPHNTLYAKGLKPLIHEIVSYGSPVAPARSGRRHVAQVFGHRGQGGYGNVPELGDVFGGLRKL